MTVSELATDTDTLTGVVAHDMSRDPFPVTGWDAVVWASGNATQAALYFQLAFGMRLEAYSGPTTGNRDHHAYVLRAGDVRFVIKGAVSPESPVADHHRRHGDGVIDVALEVPDVDKCVAHARAAGAQIVTEPHDETDEHGTVRTATIKAYGDTTHTLVDRSRYHGPYLPGLRRPHERAAAASRRRSSRSTTSSATWSSATWTSGWRSTTGSWASPTWPSSSATTSPPSTPR